MNRLITHFRDNPSPILNFRVCRKLISATRSVVFSALNRILRSQFRVEMTPISSKQIITKRPYLEGSAVTFKDVKMLTRSKYSESAVFQVPSEQCVWGWGWRCAKGEHPFISFFERQDSLRDFYRSYCPENLYSALTLNELPQRRHLGEKHDGPQGLCYKSPNVLTPHLEHSEGGVPIWSGYAKYHGPITEERLAHRVSKLQNALSSIQRSGWQPEKYGDFIGGYFLVREDNFIFIICGGQHRSAALAHLGWPTLPVTFQSGYPRVVGDWHLDGFWDQPHFGQPGLSLRQILDLYFDDSLRQKRRVFLSDILDRCAE